MICRVVKSEHIQQMAANVMPMSEDRRWYFNTKQEELRG